MFGLKFGADDGFVVSKKCVYVLIMIFWGTLPISCLVQVGLFIHLRAA